MQLHKSPSNSTPWVLFSAMHTHTQPPLAPHRTDACTQPPLTPNRTDACTQPPLTPNRTDACTQPPLAPHRTDACTQPPLTPNTKNSSACSRPVSHRTRLTLLPWLPLGQLRCSIRLDFSQSSVRTEEKFPHKYLLHEISVKPTTYILILHWFQPNTFYIFSNSVV